MSHDSVETAASLKLKKLEITFSAHHCTVEDIGDADLSAGRLNQITQTFTIVVQSIGGKIYSIREKMRADREKPASQHDTSQPHSPWLGTEMAYIGKNFRGMGIFKTRHKARRHQLEA